jgi:hypothetical protein
VLRHAHRQDPGAVGKIALRNLPFDIKPVFAAFVSLTVLVLSWFVVRWRNLRLPCLDRRKRESFALPMATWPPLTADIETLVERFRVDRPAPALEGDVAFGGSATIVPASDYVSTFRGDECRSAMSLRCPEIPPRV